MKRLIPTILLVVLCIGGFWYASSKDFFKEKKAETPTLVNVKKEDAAGYTIKTSDNVVEMQQKGGKWVMAKPSDMPLNDAEVSAWLDSFNGIAKDKTVDANPSDLVQFGLDKPKQEFTVTLNNGTSYMLSIGDPVAIQGFDYAKFSGSTEVFQISDTTVKALAKQPIDFMDRNPVKVEYEQIRSMSVDWKGQKWLLTKTETDKTSYEAKWKLDDKEIQGVDASNYLDRASALSTDQPAKKAAEIKGLNAPDLRIETEVVDNTNKETVHSYVGKMEGDQVWVVKQGGEWAYAIPATAVEQFINPPKESTQEQK